MRRVEGEAVENAQKNTGDAGDLGVLSFRTPQQDQHVRVVVWTLEILGGIIFLLGIMGIADSMLMPTFWDMPKGEIAESFTVVGILLAIGGTLIFCGAGLHLRAHWAGMACTIVLGLLAALLLTLLVAIGVDWAMHPTYPFWMTSKVIPATIIMGGLSVVLLLLLKWMVHYVRNRALYR